MKNKGLFMVLIVLVIVSTAVPSSAAGFDKQVVDVDNKSITSGVKYISPSDYLQKYGEENVNQGFNYIEDSLGIEPVYCTDEKYKTRQYDEDVNLNDLFLSLKEGAFLGKKIVGVSDISPFDASLSLKLEDNMPSPKVVSGIKQMMSFSSTGSGNHLTHYTNFDVYYSDNEPQYSTDLQNGAYEPLAGSYLYKYSYSFEQNYLCSMDVEFSGTQIHCGSQDNCVYTYVAAISNIQTIDFGLMANASDNNRNKGMYAFYNKGDGYVYAEGFPKVAATSYGSNSMTIENKTITIRLSIGDSSKPGEVEMYMESGGNCIYYRILDDSYTSSLISGSSNRALTFLEGVSCVEKDNSNTSLTSGSYYRNVKLKNSQLYSFASNSSRSFGLYGAHTYYAFVSKPSRLNLGYGSSYETISIDYHN